MKDWLSGNKSKKKGAFRKFLGPLKMIPISAGVFVSISVCVVAFGSLRQLSAAFNSSMVVEMLFLMHAVSDKRV